MRPKPERRQRQRKPSPQEAKQAAFYRACWRWLQVDRLYAEAWESRDLPLCADLLAMELDLYRRYLELKPYA